MNDLLSQLHDIEGIGQVSWWPLAPGWWVLLGGSVLLGGGVCLYKIYKNRQKRRWQRAIGEQLTFLEKNLTEKTAHATLVEVSELIRRVAIHQFSREDCAGLEGKDWLSWLTQHDPKKFKWDKRGTLLIDLPYAPPETPVPLKELRDVLKATKGWVK